MGERVIAPILNVHEKYSKVNIINSYWFVPSDPLLNTFTPAGNNLWSNPANWSLGHVPLSTETANINGGDITLDITTTVNKLTIASGRTLTADTGSRVLTVNADVAVAGTINFTGATSPNLVLKGTTNSIANFNGGASGTITYDSTTAQTVLNLPYRHLTFVGGTKNAVSNITTLGNLAVANSLQFGAYTITVGGNLMYSNVSGVLNGTGNIIVIGQVQAALGRSMTVTGGAAIELRGGVNASATINFNLSPVNFTTNNQTITGGNTFSTNNITVTGAITITTNASTDWRVASMTGTHASSTINNNGGIMHTTSSVTMLGVGTFNRMNASTSVNGYFFNGAYIIPYTTFNGLRINGTGVKTLSGNTVISTTCIVEGSAQLDCSTYDCTFTGVSTFTGGALLKSGAGNLLFIGNVVAFSGEMTFTGNPTIEFRGGLTASNGKLSMGTGALNITTNSQTFNAADKFSTGTGILNPVTIVGAITLTLTNQNYFIGAINGTVSGSTLDNRGTLTYFNLTAPMATGVLQTNAAVNTFKYNNDTSSTQDVKGGTYRNLILEDLLATGSGTGASVKRLLGNVSVVNTYTITAPVTLDLNGFTLTNP